MTYIRRTVSSAIFIMGAIVSITLSYKIAIEDIEWFFLPLLYLCLAMLLGMMGMCNQSEAL
jgi:hypothetical protein